MSTASLNTTTIPKNIHEVMESPMWKTTVMEEMGALEKDKTKSLHSSGRAKTVGFKWVFTLRYKSDRTLDKHKARLVAKGFTQIYGVDYS